MVSLSLLLFVCLLLFKSLVFVFVFGLKLVERRLDLSLAKIFSFKSVLGWEYVSCVTIGFHLFECSVVLFVVFWLWR